MPKRRRHCLTTQKGSKRHRQASPPSQAELSASTPTTQSAPISTPLLSPPPPAALPPAQSQPLPLAQPEPLPLAQPALAPPPQLRPPSVFTLRSVRSRAAFHYDPAASYVAVGDIGSMTHVCTHCRALKWKKEPESMCCANGKVVLDPLPLPPTPLRQLLTDTDPPSLRFRSRARMYNSCFQMTSFGAKNIIRYPGFMPTFKVQGQVYHLVGSLTPSPGSEPSFLQIYFIENYQEQVQRRLSSQSDAVRNAVEQPLLMALQHMLHDVNPYIRDLKTAFERGLVNDSHKIVIRPDKVPEGEHRRRYNAPQASEIAVLLLDQDANCRDIVLSTRDDTLRRVSETNRAYDSLQYPLLFPRGEDGYHLELRLCDPQSKEPFDTKMSPLQYYAYRLMQRQNELHIVLSACSLTHQFLVDAYAKMEAERMSFIRKSQKKLRADSYANLRDTLNRGDDVENIGRKVILPSSFTGSPRYMHERMQDTMTYVRNYGKPDFFVTMTCNPRWNEIISTLYERQSPSDRQDIIARVFKLKVERLMHLFGKSKICGPLRCYAYSIEWQKRGLPHVHLLTWFYDKIRPEDVDKVISAEIPNPETDPELHAIVKRNMIHGPCGNFCLVDGKCSKRFPKNFSSETRSGGDGYLQYRRRSPAEGGHTIEIRPGVEIDNRWIVPYNPFLLRVFDGHINVEYCNSVESVKYISKYINKGQDMAVFGVRPEDSDDEITCFQAARYISTNEAIWRMCAFPIHCHKPAVQKLQVHLENGQRVCFDPDNAEDVAEEPPETTLTAFFSLCSTDDFARTLLYVDVPKYFTFAKKKWRRRLRGDPVADHDDIRQSDCLGRVYTVHPNNTECYHLRLLLHIVKDPTSFAHLRTVNGVVCTSYKDACKRCGLLENDDHWHSALAEASLSQMPRCLRDMFAVMIHMCNVSDSLALWDAHKEALSEDFLYRRRRLTSQNDLPYSDLIFNEALICIEDKILSFPSGKHLPEYGIPAPDRTRDTLSSDTPREILAEQSYDQTEMTHIVESRTPSLTPDQSDVYRTICQLADSQQPDNRQGHLIFLDAPGGTGKTYLLNLILAKFRSRGDIALAVASSGIAATLLQGGKTAHSTFKLPLDLATNEYPSCDISRGSAKAQLLARAKSSYGMNAPCLIVEHSKLSIAH